MKIFDTILKKWNIVYSIIFVVGSALFVDIWASTMSVSLFIIALSILCLPTFKSVCKWIMEI
jgi:hypothetical protein